jgi:hypothetical protein
MQPETPSKSPRRDADEALEVIGDLSLAEVALQPLLGPLDAAGEDILVRRRPGGSPELPRGTRERVPSLDMSAS